MLKLESSDFVWEEFGGWEELWDDVFMVRVDGVESDLNLTTMVESKLERVVIMISLRNLYKDKLAIWN